MENQIEITDEKVIVNGKTYFPEGAHEFLQKVIELDGSESVYEIGRKYLIRTVTMTQLGKLKKVTKGELLLSDACWVADTGRFHEALEKGTLNEVEIFKRDVIVGRGGIIDATEWIGDLPKYSK